MVCFLLSKHYAFEVVGRFGCLSDPKGYVLGRFQVKGKNLAVHVGGGLDNSLTLWPCMLQGKQQKLTCKTNLSEAKCDF